MFKQTLFNAEKEKTEMERDQGGGVGEREHNHPTSTITTQHQHKHTHAYYTDKQNSWQQSTNTPVEDIEQQQNILIPPNTMHQQ
eukprot:m.132511 g.132511  ORF g.132511 m.132511 type:complete len:84 (+) comp29609_c1_seq1:3134-3385(+)